MPIGPSNVGYRGSDDPVRAFADPPLVDDAAELLASAPLHAIACCFTSSSYVRGGADECQAKKFAAIEFSWLFVVSSGCSKRCTRTDQVIASAVRPPARASTCTEAGIGE